MVIIPAIDMLDGQCVRLYKGDYNEVSVYGTDPVEIAKSFYDAGARRIHLVDLNAARGDYKGNRKKIIRIRKNIDCALELGGGIRTEDDVENMLDLGIDRLVVGTALAKNYKKIDGWVKHYGQIFIAGIDADNGAVKVSGWQDDAAWTDVDLAKIAADIGMCSIIYTNIAKDGTLEGPDLERTNAVAEASGLPVILSGGVSKLDDIDEAVKSGHKNLVAAIAGKAVYEKAIDLKEAFAKYPADGAVGALW